MNINECPKCNSEISDQDKTCPACGYKIINVKSAIDKIGIKSDGEKNITESQKEDVAAIVRLLKKRVWFSSISMISGYVFMINIATINNVIIEGLAILIAIIFMIKYYNSNALHIIFEEKGYISNGKVKYIDNYTSLAFIMFSYYIPATIIFDEYDYFYIIVILGSIAMVYFIGRLISAIRIIKGDNYLSLDKIQ